MIHFCTGGKLIFLFVQKFFDYRVEISQHFVSILLSQGFINLFKIHRIHENQRILISLLFSAQFLIAHGKLHFINASGNFI